MKRLLVRLRKIKRMILLPEPDFDREYLKRRARDISDEISEMPLKERYRFIETLRTNVTEKMTRECEEAKAKYEELSLTLKENNIYI